MHVRLDQFEALVNAARDVGTLVPLQDIVSRHLAGRSTTGLVALTADDAYASWLAAEPVLRNHDVPLTIFAVGNALSDGQGFWWDRIDDSAALATPDRWRLFEDECELPESYRLGQPAREGRVRPLRQWLLAQHAGRWPAKLDTPLQRLENDLGKRTVQRCMTESELSGFLSRTDAQLGVHTASHAALPFLSDHEVIKEVRDGYEMLRARFTGALPYLAIPFGLFDARTTRLAAEAGMSVSLTLEGVPLDRSFARDFGVPRLCVVREDSPGKLTLKMSGAAALVRRVRGQSTTSFPLLPSATT